MLTSKANICAVHFNKMLLKQCLLRGCHTRCGVQNQTLRQSNLRYIYHKRNTLKVVSAFGVADNSSAQLQCESTACEHVALDEVLEVKDLVFTGLVLQFPVTTVWAISEDNCDGCLGHFIATITELMTHTLT